MVNILRAFQRREISTKVLTATDGRDVLVNTPDGWEVDQPWLWWLGPNDGGNGNGLGPWGNPLPGANDPDALVSLPAVSRATSIICDTIAGLPWHVFRGWEQLDAPNWILDPQNLARDGRLPTERGPELVSVRLSAVEFWTEWIVSALWFGDGYVYVPQRDTAGLPQPPLFILNPDHVTIDGLRYYVDDVEIPAENLIHLRGAPPYDDGHGNGVLNRNGLDLALGLTVRRYVGDQYRSGVPYGYLKSSQPRLEEPQAIDLRNKWLATHGRGRRSIAVLNATTDFTPLAITPLDAQLSDARTWSLRDVALAFGIPAYMLGVSGDTSTYANIESRMTELKTFSLLPWIRRIESVVDAQFPRGTNLRISTGGLERADTKSRYEAYKLALDTGVMTRDEVRALENLPPLGAEADPNVPNSTTGASDGTPNAANGVTAN